MLLFRDNKKLVNRQVNFEALNSSPAGDGRSADAAIEAWHECLTSLTDLRPQFSPYDNNK